MFATMLPWLVIAALSGIILGLAFGFFLASTLVRGNYSHILTNTAKLNAQAVYTAQAQAQAQRAFMDQDRIYPR